MKNILCLILHMFLLIVRALQPGGIRKIAAENAVLRQQLLIMKGKQKRAPKLLFSDRLMLGFLMAMLNPKRILKTCLIIKPSTILKYHKALVERKYRILFSNKRVTRPGPKGPDQEIINLVIAMKRRNPRFGYRRIAMQIANAFNVDIDKDVVRRILVSVGGDKYKGDGPSWLSFIGNMKDALWSVDLFRCESILLKSHWVMVMMDQFTRRVIGFAVHAGPVDGVALCCMFNKIIANQSLPTYLSRDHDPLFKFHRWQANLRILDIEEIKTVPYTPVSHPFIERLIGTVRRELLDQVLFWNQSDLQKKLIAFFDYYNHERCHGSIEGKTPLQKAKAIKLKIINVKEHRWIKHCNGLYQLPAAA